MTLQDNGNGAAGADWIHLEDFFSFSPHGPPHKTQWRNGPVKEMSDDALQHFLSRKFKSYELPDFLLPARKRAEEKREAKWIKLGSGFDYQRGYLASCPPQFFVRIDGKVQTLWQKSCLLIMADRGLVPPSQFLD